LREQQDGTTELRQRQQPAPPAQPAQPPQEIPLPAHPGPFEQAVPAEQPQVVRAQFHFRIDLGMLVGVLVKLAVLAMIFKSQQVSVFSITVILVFVAFLYSYQAPSPSILNPQTTIRPV
jgi:hypothetical protein